MHNALTTSDNLWARKSKLSASFFIHCPNGTIQRKGRILKWARLLVWKNHSFIIFSSFFHLFNLSLLVFFAHRHLATLDCNNFQQSLKARLSNVLAMQRAYML